MPVYTVHEPPLGAAETSADPERFVFVRDGFYFWAFLFGPLWMLRRRLWLVLACYVAILLGLLGVMLIVGASVPAMTFVALLVSLLIGFEASTLRRVTLAGRGWKIAGIVTGEDAEDAERRFFDTWLQGAHSRSPTPPPAPLRVPPPLPQMPQPPDVIGLFPQPGAGR